MDIANAERPPSTTEPLNEEHSGAVTSSDVVMEVNPAYQPLEIANAHISKSGQWSLSVTFRDIFSNSEREGLVNICALLSRVHSFWKQ